jgi:hypothetical protein
LSVDRGRTDVSACCVIGDALWPRVTAGKEGTLAAGRGSETPRPIRLFMTQSKLNGFRQHLQCTGSQVGKLRL